MNGIFGIVILKKLLLGLFNKLMGKRNIINNLKSEV